MINKCTYV